MVPTARTLAASTRSTRAMIRVASRVERGSRGRVEGREREQRWSRGSGAEIESRVEVAKPGGQAKGREREQRLVEGRDREL
eukprot:2853258-Rhodomonas_salina.2